MTSDPLRSERPHRWIVVADSPFVPAHGGGEREHLGFVEAATEAGLIAALIVPADPDPAAAGRHDDLGAIRRLVAPAPVVTVPRQRSPWRAGLSRLPYVVASRPVPEGLVAELRAMELEADGVVVFSYKAHQIGQAVAEGLGLPAVLRHHNLEGAYHRALAASATPPRSWLVMLEAARIERDERRLEQSGWLTAIADISAADTRMRATRSTVPVHYVPSFALGSRTRRPDAAWHWPAGLDVVFVGALDVATNHDAVTWFAERVWPRVRAAVPAAHWRVVGRRPTAEMHRLVAATDGASLHADVTSIEPHLREARVAVNPAVSGSGVNIKLVEYVALGVPVVSTARGMAGVGLDPGTDVLVADDPRRFAEHVVAMLTSRADAERIAAAGRAAALHILDIDSSLAGVQDLLAGRPATPRPPVSTTARHEDHR